MRFEGITKSYGDVCVFRDFTLQVQDGAVTALFGPSGVGKTTLLHVASGLVPYAGEVDAARPCSYVFQEQRLLPTATVLQNLCYVLPPPPKGMPFAERRAFCRKQRENAREMLASVGLEGMEDRYPATLSGGQARRVALARAFLHPAEVLLMDEPFAGLDVGKKEELIALFLQLQRSSPRTVLFVTHDVDDGLMVAQHFVVLGGSPARVVASFHSDAPLTPTSAAFAPTYAAVRAAILSGSQMGALGEQAQGDPDSQQNGKLLK